MQTRYDDIDSAWATQSASVSVKHRSRPRREGNVGIYAQNTTCWTDWFRTTAGWRGDYFWASVNSIFSRRTPAMRQTRIGSPKFSMMFGPFYKTELFIDAGMGYHSNDARGRDHYAIAGDPTTLQDTTVSGQDQGRRDRPAHQDRFRG